MREALENKADIIIDGGYCPPEPTTVIDLSSGDIDIIRQGAGSVNILT